MMLQVYLEAWSSSRSSPLNPSNSDLFTPFPA